MKLDLFILAAAAGTAAAPAMAQGPVQIWARQTGTAVADGARAVVVDGAGGVLLTGNTNGALGGANAGLQDVFLLRGDSAGTQLWITQIGSNATDTANDIAGNGAGVSLIVGNTQGVLGAASQGAMDGFIAIHGGAGGLIGIRQFGTPQDDAATGIDKIGAGDAMVCGWTAGNFAAANAGGDDAYVLRYDASVNNIIWAQQFGTAGDDRAEAVAIFGGGIATVGSTEGNLGAPNAGQLDVFVAVHSPAGNPLWVRQFGTAATEIATDVAPDGAGGVIVTGSTFGNLQGANQGGTDIFLARFDGAGNPVWLRQFGTASFDLADRVELAGGSVFFTGQTNGSLFGANAGFFDALLARVDPISNTLTWGYQYGTPQDDDAFGLAVDGPGGIFVSGSTAGDLGGSNAGLDDAYLVRFAQACYADCNASGSLSVADFGCFQTKFVSADSYADCNDDGSLTVADFGCFQTKFVAGCP